MEIRHSLEDRVVSGQELGPLLAQESSSSTPSTVLKFPDEGAWLDTDEYEIQS